MDVQQFYEYYGQSPGFLRVMVTDNLRQTHKMLTRIKKGTIGISETPDEIYDRIVKKSKRICMKDVSLHAKKCKTAFLNNNSHMKRLNEFILFIETYTLPI